MRWIFLIPLFSLLVSLALPAQADIYDQAFQAADRKNWREAASLARKTQQSYLVDYVNWRRYRGASDRAGAEEILGFLQQHPDWPDQTRLITRAAEALLLEGFTAAQAQRWKRLSKQPRPLLEYGWIHGYFTRDEQKRVFQRYGDQFSRALIEERIDRLLWDNQTSRASELLDNVGKGFANLSQARIAYLNRARTAPRKLNRLDSLQRRDPGLYFAMIAYHRKKGQHRRVEKILKELPGKVPYGEKWWSIWRYYTREALSEERYQDAYDILKPIRHAEEGTQAQLFWLRGWIQLQFLNRPAEAYKDFYIFHKHVGTPISLARGAFWAGLAAHQNGNAIIARNWFAEAAKYPMTFYGQMAKLQQSQATRLGLHTQRLTARPSAAMQGQLPLIRLLARYEQDYSVELFLDNLTSQASDDRQLFAIAQEARQLGYPHLAVRMGKQYFAEQQEWVQAVSHPLLTLPPGLAIEPALTLAIARQESEFNPKARSRADARGLMQLLPSTARNTARKHNIRHSTAMLYQPQHNMKLGSLYLAELIEEFDGHYPLAIAGYNAGPGRVRDWLERFGPFPADPIQRLKWLEQIPFSETRNYVQRVLENLQTYRSLLNQNNTLTPKTMMQR